MLDDLPESLAAHALAVHVDEQRRFLRISQKLRTHLLHVVRKCLDGGGIEWDDTLFALALRADEARAQAHVLFIERNELGDADARGVQQFEHRVVAVALSVHALGLVKEELDLFAREDLGELVLHLHRGNALGRVRADLSGHLEVGVERLDRRDGARDRRGGLALAAHPGDIAADDLLRHLRQRHGVELVQIHGELVQIAHIGAERILGGVLFRGQIFFVLRQKVGHDRTPPSQKTVQDAASSKNCGTSHSSSRAANNKHTQQMPKRYQYALP